MSIHSLIAQGGRGTPSPVQRYMQGRQIAEQRDSSRLQDMAQRQTMQMNRQKMQIQRQDQVYKSLGFAAKQAEASDNPEQTWKRLSTKIGADSGLDPQQAPKYSKSLMKNYMDRAGIKAETAFTKPAAKDFTPESRRIYAKTRNQADLVVKPKQGKLLTDVEEAQKIRIKQASKTPKISSVTRVDIENVTTVISNMDKYAVLENKEEFSLAIASRVEEIMNDDRTIGQYEAISQAIIELDPHVQESKNEPLFSPYGIFDTETKRFKVTK